MRQGLNKTMKQVMLEGPDVLFPDMSWKDDKVVTEYSVQHMIHLHNGLQMSVIRGEHTYGGPKLFEIAPMDSDREFIGQSMLGWNDDVKGHLTLEAVKFECQLLQELNI